MKKWLFALLAGALVLSSAMSASATSLKTYGYFIAGAVNIANSNFNSQTDADRFTVSQRLRFFFDFVANENLKATVGLEINQIWGDPNSGATQMDRTNIMRVKRAMLTFKWPNTNVTFKIGAQGVGLPGGLTDNPVLFCDIAGVLVNVPVNDMVGVTAGWLRPWHEDLAGNTGLGTDGGQIDAFLLSVPVKMEGFSVNPYFLYASIDKNTLLPARESDLLPWTGAVLPLADDAKAWWLGMGYKVSMFEPIVLKGQFIYGKLDAERDVNDRSGWFMDIAAAYKMDMMTPMVYFLYSSGDDANANDGSEMLPLLGYDGVTGTPAGFAIGVRSAFVPIAMDGLYSGVPLGVWSLGIALKDISVVNNLSSTLALEYGKGTTDKDLILRYGAAGSYLTTEDSYFQMRLDSTYKIYENLAAILELGYAKLNMDDSVWGPNYMDDGAYGIAFGFKYKF